MAEPDALHALLSEAADPPGGPLAPPPGLRQRARARQRRRRAGLLGAVVVTVAAVTAVPAVLVSRSAGPRPAGPPTPPPSPAATATAIAHDVWSTLPPAPLPARADAAAVWTGRQLLVWGGQSGRAQTLHGDGAGYDPASRRWQVLPAAPLGPRAQAASVWTGRALFVWGGRTGPQQAAADGALYDPRTRRWQRLPASPLAPRVGAHALLAGDQVIVVGGQPAVLTDRRGPYLDAAAYDLTTGRWHRLPAPPLPIQHSWSPSPDPNSGTPPRPDPVQVGDVEAVAAGTDVYVWALWSQTAHLTASSFEGRTGIDLAVYSTTTGRWSLPHTSGPAPTNVSQPVWTGRRILQPAVGPWRGPFSGPLSTNRQGWTLDPATRTWRELPHGPVDDLNATAVWTGAALLEVNSGTYSSGPDDTHLPGEAAVYDPATGRWTALPHAPYTGYEAVTVWAGDRLLVWGQLSPPTTPGRPQRSADIGLQLAPPGQGATIPSPSPDGGPAPPCTPAALSARVGWQGATGSMLGAIVVTNTSGTACTVRGVPAVALTAGGRRLPVQQVARLGRPQPDRPVTLSAGGSAQARIQWFNWCGEARPTVTVELRLDAGTVSARAPSGTPRCDGRRAGSTVAVGAFQPEAGGGATTTPTAGG